VAKPLLPNQLLAYIEPLLPPHLPSKERGHPPITPRQALTGILFVLKTRMLWENQLK
jgi:hypothetical protein